MRALYSVHISFSNQSRKLRRAEIVRKYFEKGMNDDIYIHYSKKIDNLLSTQIQMKNFIHLTFLDISSYSKNAAFHICTTKGESDYINVFQNFGTSH